LAITPPRFIGGAQTSFQNTAGPAHFRRRRMMKSTITAASLLLAGSAFIAVPAAAQSNYGAAPSAPQQTPTQGDQDQKPASQPKVKVSRGAVSALKALDAAVKAKNGAEVAAKVQEANAVAKTPDDKYMVGVLQYQYAVAAKDDTMRAAAIEAMIASGFKGVPLADLYGDLGSTYTRLKQDQRAADAYQHALQLDPNNVDAVAANAEAKVAAGQVAEGLALLQKGIALQSAGGAKAPESWYKRALAIAYKAKLPQTVQLSRDWIQAYPSATGWHDALAIYQNLTALDDSHALDLMRLKRAVKVLSPSDYFKYGDIAVQKGFPGEAKSVLEQGFAAKAIDKSNASFSQLYALASQRAQGDRASLPAAPAADQNAHRLIVVGDAYYGYGEYAKAADFYRAAVAKGDSEANAANLHLGMALAAQGDKAGAAAALNKVGGDYADLAKFWLLYVGSNA
jgi:tetratricopeptide (TPR) repeat protein